MSAPAVDSAALVQSAYKAFESGQMGVAEADCRRALAIDPNHTGALALAGFIELSQSRCGEAVPVFDLLCRLEPAEATHWMNLGTAYRGVGNADDSLKAYSRAAELGERSATFYYNLGLTHLARGDFEAGRVVLDDALKLVPDDDEVRYQYVRCCYECMRYELALAALEHWTPSAGAHPEVLAGSAQMLLNMGEYARAESMLQLAACGGDGEPGAMLIMVQIFERTNRLEQAERLLAQLAARPDAALLGAELQWVSAKIAQRQSKHELAIELYRQALVDYGKPHERHFIQFKLVESLHALGRHDETMATLIQANRSQTLYIRRNRPMAAVRGVPQLDVANYHCDPTDVASWDHSRAPAATDSPVFVVAFPRSGTTLLELTLDAHPLLRSMDEQPFVQNALEDILKHGIVYPEQIGQLDDRQLDALRERYWERTRGKVQLEPGQRLVDKNPLNILRLPVMRRLFPNAPILLAIRHPYDVILSCYMQHFRAPDFALLCADMPALAHGYRRTFDFWYAHVDMLAPRVHEVRYESLVADFPAEVRRITEFLELPWDAAMLRPAERAHAKRFISTPSYAQVTQPVNQRSVGRWQAYRQYLEPAYPIVEPYLRRWGYQV
jgi:tetratricopeptide (TPR) repeat protein